MPDILNLWVGLITQKQIDILVSIHLLKTGIDLIKKDSIKSNMQNHLLISIHILLLLIYYLSSLVSEYLVDHLHLDLLMEQMGLFFDKCGQNIYKFLICD